MRFEFEPQQPMRRAKLWEIEPRFHCLVIGTCLTIEELRRLAQRAGIDTAANDYELHHDLVQLAGSAQLRQPCRVLARQALVQTGCEAVRAATLGRAGRLYRRLARTRGE